MRRIHATVLPGLAVLCCLGGLLALLDHRAGRAPGGGRSAAEKLGTTADVSVATRPARRPVGEDARASTTAASPDFDAVIDHLVDLGLGLAENFADGSLDAEARETNRRAERLLDELARTFLDAPERALLRLSSSNTPADERATMRRAVLLRVLEDGLAARLARARHGGGRQPLDALVGAMLETIPASAELADVLGAPLVDAPYVGDAHEAAVLDIADQAREREFLAPLAAALLRTLWHNLRATGARTEAEISAFALLLQDDLNSSRRRAAFAELLTAEGGRYRQLVVERVVRARDGALARELAAVAARELPPDIALDVLQELHPVAGASALGAFLAVAERDGRAVAERYEHLLTDGRRPELRAELVSGAFTTPGPEGLALAAAAFERDPDPVVRRRALFALSAHPDPGAAAAALESALDDPRTGADPEWIADVAGALRNLAGRPGSHAAVLRIGARLVDHPLLPDGTRDRVRALLEREKGGD